jgi:hypothetical protein
MTYRGPSSAPARMKLKSFVKGLEYVGGISKASTPVELKSNGEINKNGA